MMRISKDVSAKPWVVVAVMAMMCLMPYQSVDLTNLSEDSVKSESSGNSHEILIMGNSYVASNSLHNLVDGVMNDASITSNVSALTGGGMRLIPTLEQCCILQATNGILRSITAIGIG